MKPLLLSAILISSIAAKAQTAVKVLKDGGGSIMTGHGLKVDVNGRLVVDSDKVVSANFIQQLRKLATADSLHMQNTVEPPTPSAGGIIYVENGALKYKSSTGAVTTIALP